MQENDSRIGYRLRNTEGYDEELMNCKDDST